MVEHFERSWRIITQLRLDRHQRVSRENSKLSFTLLIEPCAPSRNKILIVKCTNFNNSHNWTPGLKANVVTKSHLILQSYVMGFRLQNLYHISWSRTIEKYHYRFY